MAEISREKAIKNLNTFIEFMKNTQTDSDNPYFWSKEDYLSFAKAISDMEKLESYRRKLSNAYGECDTLLDAVVDGLVKQAEEHKIGQPRKARLLTDEDVDLWEQSKSDREKLEKIEHELKSWYENAPLRTQKDDIEMLLRMVDLLEIEFEQIVKG